MTEHNITLAVGATKVLHTAGTYCDRDIVVTAEKGDGYDNGYNEGLEAGKKAEHDAFWDAYQQNGNRTDYRYAFSAIGWNDQTFKPKHDIKPTNAISMFYRSTITSLTRLLTEAGVVLDTSNANEVSSIFSDCVSLKDAPHIDLSSADYCGAVFSWCNSLKTAEVTFSDKNTDYYNTFFRCDSLENLTVHGTIPIGISLANSSKLTATSVQSVIDCLKDLTGATAQTITFHATAGGKLTDEQKAAISAKNWTLVY